MKTKRFFIALYAVLLLLTVFPVRAEAMGRGTYHPPALTIVAFGAPADLELQVEMEYDGERFPVTMQRENRLWESQFRLFREGSFRKTAWFGSDKDFAGAVLLLHSGGEERRIPIPQELLTPGSREEYMTLSVGGGKLSAGLPGWRKPALFCLRLLLLFAVKGLLFFLMDYRHRDSWLKLLAVELPVQGLLNGIISGWINVDLENAMPLFVLVLLLAFLAELVALMLLINESSRNKTMSYAATANFIGSVMYFGMLSFLPI